MNFLLIFPSVLIFIRVVINLGEGYEHYKEASNGGSPRHSRSYGLDVLLLFILVACLAVQPAEDRSVTWPIALVVAIAALALSYATWPLLTRMGTKAAQKRSLPTDPG